MWFSMKSALIRYERWSDIFVGLVEYLSGLLFLLSVILATYEVVMRYCFSSATDWGSLVVRSLLVYAALLAAAAALREERHTKIDVFLNRLKGKSRKILDICLSFTIIVTCALVAWSSVKMVLTHKFLGGVSTTSIEIPFWVRYLILPTSFGLCTWFGIERFIKVVYKPPSEHD